MVHIHSESIVVSGSYMEKRLPCGDGVLTSEIMIDRVEDYAVMPRAKTQVPYTIRCNKIEHL